MLKYMPVALALLAVTIAGCGGGGGGGGEPVPAPGDNPSGIEITISPMALTLKGGEQIQFTSTVTGTTDHSVKWEVTEVVDGGVVSLVGLYTAPSTPGTAHVKVTSLADLTKSDTAEITITQGDDGSGGDGGVSVSITPQEAVLEPGKTQQFTATVSGHSNTAVDWIVLEGTSGGTITGDGFYTAPDTNGTYHVTATSRADNTKSATVIVNVLNHPPIPIPTP